MIEQDPRYQRILRMIERDTEIRRLRLEEKWTLQRIGDLFDISRERVRQITKERKLK